MILEHGHYLTLRYEGDAKVMCGPFTTAQHAWDYAYVCDILDVRKSDSQRLLAYSKSGDFMSIMSSKYIQEDLDSAVSEGVKANYRFVAEPELKYPDLIGADGLLIR
jgi:hypothetical protein